MSNQTSNSSPTLHRKRDEQSEVMELLGSLLKEDDQNDEVLNKSNPTNSFFTMGLAGAFVIAHGAILLSLPPVIRGKGAPFLPTSNENMDRIFRLIKKQPQIRLKLQKQKTATKLNSPALALKFVDLGSGDGRMVFRSAREPNLFQKSIGYEINPGNLYSLFKKTHLLNECWCIDEIINPYFSFPCGLCTKSKVLHIFAQTRKVVQFSSYYSNTFFYRKDLWSINLSNIDVIAVYGLYPIMDRLGKKIEKEATPGTIVMSNLFSIPHWKPISVEKGVFVYSIPESLR